MTMPVIIADRAHSARHRKTSPAAWVAAIEAHTDDIEAATGFAVDNALHARRALTSMARN